MITIISKLDKMSREDLLKFWSKYTSATLKEAQALVGPFKDAKVLAHDLANYASNKAAEKFCKEQKDALGASIYKTISTRIADRLYRR